MRSPTGALTIPLVGCAGILWMAVALCAQPPATSGDPPAGEKQGAVPLAVARDRAKLMHEIYTSTLEMMHQRYFHGEKAMVPARALEDVFSEMRRQSKVDARWISVNTRPMSIDHEPKTEFEKRAALEISRGTLEFDAVEDGTYRRAGAIALHGGCVNCHGGFFREASKTARYAGLVISIPLTDDTPSP
ncbi:MAG: DUF3365 domain-containing protein [Planctomycetaceae bacterium]|nr:MAG: DUF3365 domain-containing protein [Planctomycetaceae bacterium]